MTSAMSIERDRTAAELMTFASAWVRRPLARIREVKGVASALLPDEWPEALFLVHRGRFTGRSGLLFVTASRLLFVQSFLWRTRVMPIPWSTIKRVNLTEEEHTADLRVETTGASWNFWIVGQQKHELRHLHELVRRRVSDEAAEGSPDPPTRSPG
jgi:hypothetical protein